MKRKLLVIGVLVLAVNLLCSCGTGSNNDTDTSSDSISYSDTNVKADESYFEWDGNYITAITEEGSKQKSIVIPARCEGFFGADFSETEIENVFFEDDDDVELSAAFAGAKNLLSIQLPKNLTKISRLAFSGCVNLKSIVIPSEVSVIEEYAFSRCSSLEEVAFEGEKLTLIGVNSFDYCTSLKSIVLPEGVTSIEEYAFFECSSLENVRFPSTVSSIGLCAFGNTALEEIHFPADMEISYMDVTAFGVNTYYMTVYITQGSWCDENRDIWDIEFGEIIYE